MAKKKYIVDLSNTERDALNQLLCHGKHSSRRLTGRAFSSKRLTDALIKRLFQLLESASLQSSAPVNASLSVVWEHSTNDHALAKDPSLMPRPKPA